MKIKSFIHENKCRKGNKYYFYLLLCLSASTNNLFSFQSMFVNYFRVTKN